VGIKINLSTIQLFNPSLQHRVFLGLVYVGIQNPRNGKEKILVIGASGQIGVELTQALRKIYGNSNVVLPTFGRE